MLTYLNYKLPLKPITDGHGYYGTLAQTEDGAEVQCHICGELCANLGTHAYRVHGLLARDYRKKFQLGRTTPLCSDVYSQTVKAKKMAHWDNLTEDQKEAVRERMREVASRANRIGNPRSLEALNKDGMCPDQLIEKIQTLATKLGKSPSYKQFCDEYEYKYTGAIIRTFGSWNGAKRVASLPSCKSGGNPHNRLAYSNDDLLEILRSFYKEKGYKPTHSDWVRGFLPNYYVYQHRFGGIRQARELAGI